MGGRSLRMSRHNGMTLNIKVKLKEIEVCLLNWWMDSCEDRALINAEWSFVKWTHYDLLLKFFLNRIIEWGSCYETSYHTSRKMTHALLSVGRGEYILSFCHHNLFCDCWWPSCKTALLDLNSQFPQLTVWCDKTLLTMHRLCLSIDCFPDFH